MNSPSTSAAPESEAVNAPAESYGKLFLRFLRFGALAWGGPVAQIDMIRQELVAQEKWISPAHFKRLLAIYQVLPGPEAHELCVHFGMLARGRTGGLLAGLGFMLPGFVLIFILSWAYLAFDLTATAFQAVFLGIQPAVIALIVRACHRIGGHCLTDGPLWVIGILAARIKDRLHRPTIAFADGDVGQLKGSARSIPGIHIRDILDAVATRHPGLITRFGGHAMAAGLTLPRAAYADFAAAFVAEVARHAQDVELQARIESDGELSPDDLQLALATELRFAGPWGQHFPEPVFDGRFALVSQRLVGEKHLKLLLTPTGSGMLIDAIAFNVDLAIWPNPGVEQVEIAYRLDVNEFRGQRSLQLMVEHLVAL